MKKRNKHRQDHRKQYTSSETYRIEYRAKLCGIKTIRQEESYTSKADALALDYIPIYKKLETNKHKFSGKRKLRGLYESPVGKLINADVNGALNRKYSQNLSVTCDSLIQEIIGRGLVFQPVRMFVHPYKSSHKGSPGNCVSS